MRTTAATERAREEAHPEARAGGILGHPLAFLATALILLALFGWTFVSNPDRVAPTKDPAYYTWRTETQLSEEPQTLLEVEGAYEMFSGGYRVASSVIGGYLRRIADFSSLNATAMMMVVVPVLTALLLAGFAYRHRRDPLVFHTVAFGVGSLYLTPPFVGYLDNVLCLMFLAAAIWFIGPARTLWPGRIALFMFLLLAGFTHPTTLVIFCFVLGLISVARLLFRKFDLRSVVRDDWPMLATAFAAAVTTFLIWQVGIWGRSAKLTEAALPPPYDSDFFLERMGTWISAMTPVLNAPLFLIGLVGIFVIGKRWVEDEFTTITFVWLAPLAGLFLFLAGITTPYYRFFNTTVTWVMLVGLGGFFLIRFVESRTASTPVGKPATVLVALAVAAVFAFNFAKGFDTSGWNDPGKGWLSVDEKREMDSLRLALLGQFGSEAEDEEGTVEADPPVIFAIDTETEGFQVWGETKLAGNTSRYGLPAGLVDQGYLYLGSVENLLNDEPTFRGDGREPTEECTDDELGTNTYNCLSLALLEDARAGMERSPAKPVVVVASVFNATGSNAEVVSSVPARRDLDGDLPNANVLFVNGADVLPLDGPKVVVDAEESDEGVVHILRVLGSLLLLLIPGILFVRFTIRDATLGEALGLVPVASLALLTLAGVVVLAVTRSPFGSEVAWMSLVIATLGSALGLVRGRGRRASESTA